MDHWPRVLACGLATLDVVQTLERVPGANEKVVAQGLAVAAGGPAANAAVTCAALGVGVRLVTRVGGGALGAVVREDLAGAGVEVVDIADAAARPPVSTVLVTRATGERAVVSVNGTDGPGAGRGGGSGAARVGPAPEVWDGVGVVLVDGHHLDLALAVAREARARGVPVLLDGGSWKPGLEALLAVVDVAVVSADLVVPTDVVTPAEDAPAEAGSGGDQRVGTGPDERAPTDVCAVVSALGPRVVARSAGGGPIEVLVAGDGRTRVPVPTVTVVDTLGAGDVLHGALAAWWTSALVRGSTSDVPDVVAGLTWAAEVASASCAAPGARGWVADETLVARLRDDLGRGPRA